MAMCTRRSVGVAASHHRRP